MDTEWTIVRLTTADYDVIRAVWEQAGLSIRPGGRDNFDSFTIQMAGGSQTAIGLRVGDQLVGVVIATHDGRKGWINRLAVHPEFRHQGVATQLIAEAELVLHDQGMRIIAALIEGYNEASLAVFQRAGYVDYPNIHYLTKRDADDV